MGTPTIVWLIVGIAFLVALGEWVYGAVEGVGEAVPEGYHRVKRIIRSVFLAVIFMLIVFFGIVIATECPNQNRIRERAFAKLRCDEYLSLKGSLSNTLEKLSNFFEYKPE